ncbi:hypothetical protein JCM3770_002525 [Rhodotorula araucariae]
MSSSQLAQRKHPTDASLYFCACSLTHALPPAASPAGTSFPPRQRALGEADAADGELVNGATARSPPRAHIAQLPNELLHTIFVFAATPSRRRPPHGGAVRAWHSYERAAPFRLVCRQWQGPAQAVLFSSVALIGHRRASAFVAALSTSPRAGMLASQTACVVLALDAAVEASSDDSHGQLATSALLVAALEACSSASHVHIRALHHGVRERLHATLMDPNRELVSLVLSPRNLASAPWSTRLWRLEDGPNLRPSVENLEHTSLISPFPAPHGVAAIARAAGVTSFPTMALRRLKLWYDWPAEIIVEAFKSSPNLEYLDLYFEHDKPTDTLAQALLVSARSLREVRYMYNPTSADIDGGDSPPRSASSSSSSTSDGGRVPPAALFDVLLPSLTSLEVLHCSATELTPSALLALPASLSELRVKSFNARSRFRSGALLAVLRRDDLALPDAFARLAVVDSPDAGWDDDVVAAVARECARRGVRFAFKMDFEDEGLESSTTHGTEASGASVPDAEPRRRSGSASRSASGSGSAGTEEHEA